MHNPYKRLFLHAFLKVLLFFFFFITITKASHLNLSNEEINYINYNKVKVAMLPDFRPFSYNENSQQKGLSYDILKLISYKSGLNFEYHTNKWPKNLKYLKENRIDMIDSISYVKDREAYINFTKPYHESPLIIFSRKELTSYDGLHSLKNKKLGNTKNTFYQKDIEKLNLFHIIEYKSFQDKSKALAFGEIDIMLGHLHSTLNNIHKHGYTNIKALDELNLSTLKKTDLRFGINKNNIILFSIVSKSLD